MTPLTILNDLHIGAIRSGGTTPATALQLRLKLLKNYSDLLDTIDADLLINGDMLDSASVPMSDLLEAYRLTAKWLSKGHKLIASSGNHDLSRNSTVLSSFQFLVKLLSSSYPDQVTHVEGSRYFPEHDAYVISHVPNQDLFDLELSKVPACKCLFLHCNYDNNFAVKSDHSLNLSPEQATASLAERIILGHEHQARTIGKVFIVGNQFPSSVSDCLGNNSKHMLLISDDIILNFPTWQAEGSFTMQDWQCLSDVGDFIRVTGEATPEEAGAVVTAISKFRSQAKALVITNAVVIGGVEIGDVNLSLEQIQSFSVLDALLELLTAEEGLVILNLMKENSIV